MVAGILTISSLTLSSCGQVDNVGSPTKTVEDELFEKIGGVYIDKSMEDYGVVRVFDFNEDNSFECYAYYQEDVDADGIMDKDEFIQEYLVGTWSAAGKVKCDVDGGSYDGVNLNYRVKNYYDEDGNVLAEGETTDYSDLIFLIPVGDGYAFINCSELYELFSDYEASGAAQHRSFADFLAGIGKIATKVGDAFKTAGEKIGKGVVAGVKWVKKLVVEAYDSDISGESDWMAKTFKDVNPKIHQISLPGSHDTFTYGVTRILSHWGKTQVLNIEQQFDAGVRFFDLRLKYRDNWPFDPYFQLNHGPLGCGITMPESLDKLVALLKAHPGETIVISLKYEACDETQEGMTLMRNTLDKYKDYIVDPSLYKKDLRLNDCRGKMVLTQRFSAVGKTWDNGSIGIFANGDNNAVVKCGYGPYVWDYMEQDMCEFNTPIALPNTIIAKETDHYQKRIAMLEENMADAANPPSTRPDTWHQNKTSGYIKFLGGVILAKDINACIMNNAATSYIRQHMGQKTGWIITDYAGVNSYGAVGSKDVGGADLLRVLLDNNIKMVEDGVFD